LEAQPELVGWIEARYQLFCASLGVSWPPPFKDFARELAHEMRRERVDVRRSGKRETFTTYRVPSTAVVELPEEKRRRA